MIIIDFSQLAIAPIFTDSIASECAKNPSDSSKQIIKHMVLNSIRSTQVTNKSFGGVVVACDSNSWRKEVFPQYKYQRREARKKDTSGIDWDFVHSVTDETIKDLDTYFPYPLIRVSGAEGDDIIGTLTKHVTQESMKTSDEDMFGEREPEKILIVSSDRDNFQLHKYKNVRQYSPAEKKMVSPKISYKASLIEKIVKGESGPTSDSIPNIRMEDDNFVQGIRQKPISSIYLEEFIKSDNPIDVCKTNEERIHYARNERLVSYDFIPKNIEESIIMCYNTQLNKKHSKMDLMNYFINQKMNNLLSNIMDFYV